MLNYDPDATSQVSPEEFERGLALGFHPINVICDEPDAKYGDHTGVSFIAFGPFVPRVGDQIKIQDGKLCTVTKVCFNVLGDDKLKTIVPNVCAVVSRVPPLRE